MRGKREKKMKMASASTAKVGKGGGREKGRTQQKEDGEKEGKESGAGVLGGSRLDFPIGAA